MDRQLRPEMQLPPYQPQPQPIVQVIYVQENVYVRPSLILGLLGFLLETAVTVVVFVLIMAWVLS